MTRSMVFRGRLIEENDIEIARIRLLYG